MVRSVYDPSRDGDARLSDVIERALALHRAGKLVDAELLYRSALAADSSNAEARRLLGVLKPQQGRHGEALALTTEAVRLQPGSAKSHSALGSVQLALNRCEDAVASYRTATRLEPDVAGNHYNHAVALQAMNHHRDALKSFDRAIAIQPRFPEALTATARTRLAASHAVPADLRR